jgi:membrane-associated protein
LELARHLVAHYGYLAVFVGTFLEGETVLLAGAFAAAHGLLAAPLVAGVAAAGAWSGHLVFFSIGRWKGREWLYSRPRLGRHARRADAVIVRYGWTSVFILQYLYGARAAGAILFGLSSFTLPRFLALQAVNCAIWAALVTAAGYLLGATLDRVAERLTWVSAGIVLVLLGVLLWTVRRRFWRGPPEAPEDRP